MKNIILFAFFIITVIVVVFLCVHDTIDKEMYNDEYPEFIDINEKLEKCIQENRNCDLLKNKIDAMKMHKNNTIKNIFMRWIYTRIKYDEKTYIIIYY